MNWNKHIHTFLIAGFLIFLLLSLLVLNVLEVEFSGFLFVVAVISLLLYFILITLWSRWKHWCRTPDYTTRELLILTGVVSILSIGVTCESYDIHNGLAVVFGELSLFSFIGTIWIYRNRNENNSTQLLGLSGISLLGIALAVITISAILAMDGDDGMEGFALLLVLATIFLLVVFAIRWLVGQIRAIAQLKKEQSTTELKQLQNQVNPHFFFNMLNNLYGVVGQDTKKAQELILKLSDLMRYSIYDGQKEWATIEEEIDYLQNYIELQKMRYRKDIEIKFEIEKDREGYKILPLLLIILVENAFKHGVEKLRSDAYVHVSLRAVGDQLVFSISNNFDVDDSTNQGGIGLSNLRRRLELVYPKQHSLDIVSDSGVYHVHLTLPAI